MPYIQAFKHLRHLIAITLWGQSGTGLISVPLARLNVGSDCEKSHDFSPKWGSFRTFFLWKIISHDAKQRRLQKKEQEMTLDAFHLVAKSQKIEIAEPERATSSSDEDSFDIAVAPASTANAIPVDLELVLLNDVSGNVAINKYDLTAVRDGDRADFTETNAGFTGDYIL